MKRVVERCPNCGVEHDEAHGGACEVCGTTLRYWCRVHSREIGWLDAPECPRCAAEAAAYSPRAPTPPPPAPRVEAPPPPPPVEAPPPRVVPSEPPPRRRRTIVVSPAPVERSDPLPPAPPPYAGRDPRDVMRDTAEDLAPHVATGARVAGRMFRAMLAIVFAVIGWGLFGAIAGGAYAYFALSGQGANSAPGVDLAWGALFGATVGGGFGLFIGFIRAIRILFSQPPREG